MNAAAKGNQRRRGVPYRWITVWLVAILAFFFFAFFASRYSEAGLILEVAGTRVVVNTSALASRSQTAEDIDSSKHFVDDSLGFSIKKPTEGNWSAAETLHGFAALMEAKGAVLNQDLLDQIEANFAISPFGAMLNDMTTVRFVSGDTLTIETTEDTTNDLIDRVVERAKAAVVESGFDWLPQDETELRDGLVGFKRLEFANELTVSVYDKELLAGAPVKPSLAAFTLQFLSAYGASLDTLVADDVLILAASTILLKGVTLDGTPDRQVRIDRVFLTTESENRFYAVEIGFSPQTSSSLRTWQELEDMLKSFRTLG